VLEITSLRSAFPASCRGLLSCLALPLCLFVTNAGCGTMTNSKVVQQLRNENDRLLAEYRAQRDQNLQLSQRLNDTQARLAESEKMLARLSPLSPNQRLSRLSSDPSTNFQSSTQRASQLNATAATGAPAGGIGSNPPADYDPSQSLDFQWRPMRKEPRQQ
jgi:hypothetical protein